MKVLAVYAIKGGVGKTATAVNLAYEAVASGGRVLIWDLDPQGAATFYFRNDPKVRGGGAKIISGAIELARHIRETEYEGLDIIPADFSYRNFDLMLDDQARPTQVLGKLLKPLEEYYDYVFLDCPPGLSLLSENVLKAADAVIVPVIPTTLSLNTLDQLLEFTSSRGYRNTNVLPFLSMVDRHKKLHKDVLRTFHRNYKGTLKASIPYSSVIERMGEEQDPVGYYAPGSEAAQAFTALWKQIQRRI